MTKRLQVPKFANATQRNRMCKAIRERRRQLSIYVYGAKERNLLCYSYALRLEAKRFELISSY